MQSVKTLTGKHGSYGAVATTAPNADDEQPRTWNCAIHPLHALKIKLCMQINDLMAIECEDAEVADDSVFAVESASRALDKPRNSSRSTEHSASATAVVDHPVRIGCKACRAKCRFHGCLRSLMRIQ